MILKLNVSDVCFFWNFVFKEGFEFYVDYEGLYWKFRGFDKVFMW